MVVPDPPRNEIRNVSLRIAEAFFAILVGNIFLLEDIHGRFKWLSCDLMRHKGPESVRNAMWCCESYLRSHPNIGSHNKVRVLTRSPYRRSGHR